MKTLRILLITCLLCSAPSAYAEPETLFTCIIEHFKPGKEEKPSVEALKEKEQESTDQQTNLIRSSMKRGKQLGFLLLGTVLGGIGTSYDEDVSVLYDKYIKEPIREYEKRKYLVAKFGGKEKVAEAIERFKSGDVTFLSQKWGELQHADHKRLIVEREGNFKDFLTPFQAFSPKAKQDLLSKEKFFSELSDQMLLNESIFTQALLQSRNSLLSPSEKIAVNGVKVEAQRRLDYAVSLWTVYSFASPENELKKIDQNLVLRFTEARDFVMNNTDLTIYRDALSQRAKETIGILEEIKE